MKLFLIEKGQFVVISKDKAEVSFGSLDEYQRYSGVDVSDKNYVCYQPADGFEIDDSQQDKKISPDFKAIILTELDRVDEYIANRADIYWGKTEAERKEIKKSILNADMQGYLNGFYDVPTQMSMQAIYTKPDTPAEVKVEIESIWNWIQAILVYYYQKKEEIDVDFDATWDYAAFTDSRPEITLADLLGA